MLFGRAVTLLLKKISAPTVAVCRKIMSQDWVEKEAVDLYRQFAKFPSTTEASFSRARCGDAHVINTVRSQRDLERTTSVKFSKSYCVRVPDSGNCEVIYSTNPQEISNELWNKESPSGKYRAVVRKVTDKKQEEKFYVEVWDGNHKIENVETLSLEKHGKIYDGDGYFGCLEWSRSEDKLLYVAEKKYTKAVSYFTKKQEGADDKSKEGEAPKTAPGEEYVYREEWGEGLVGKHHPVICVLTIATGEVTVLEGVPDDVSPGQAIWTDNGIIFTGWKHEPYRLGLIYCPIRKGTLFHVNLQTGKCDVLSSEEKASRCATMSPDGKQLVYLQNREGGPHMQCVQLMLYDLVNKTTKTVVDVVKQPKDGEFPGLYTVLLQKDCWATDNLRVVFNSIWRSQTVAVVINTATGKVSRLPTAIDPNGGMTVLSIKNDVIVAQCSSPCRPCQLVVGRLPANGKEGTLEWSPLDSSQEQIEDIAWKISQHKPTPDRVNSEYPDLNYESIHIFNTAKTTSKKLIVFPHGGPHSVFTTDFMLYPVLLCKLGYSSLLVNYRGSIGFGSDSIYSLPGKCGDQDVKDVQSAALEVIEKEGYDKDKVVVWGGSHGGFLTTHLVGQYPGFYKAAVCRNPVINMSTMSGSSDIPDWCMVESGTDFAFDKLSTPDLMEKMWKCSPLQYVDKIQTPMMIMIGNDDKRCPPTQSYELYKALKARNKPVRYIAYPDNGHPIVKVDSEADAFINIYKWFTQYVPEN